MRLKLVLLALLSALALAACGGGYSTHHGHAARSQKQTRALTLKTMPPVQSVLGHPCTGGTYVHQCSNLNQIGQKAELPPVPRGVAHGRGISPQSPLHGVDFAFNSMSPSATLSVGGHFGVSYLSYSTVGKNWSLGLWDAYHAAGLGTVLNWEWGCCDAGQGYGVGQQEARQALAEANSLGASSTRPIYFSVDYPASWSAVASYFSGVKSILGNRTGVYGSYAVVSGAYAAGIHWLWQTSAWSGGAWFWQHNNLEQYAYPSNAYDADLALTNDYGQTPSPSNPKPPPKPKLGGTANAAGGMSDTSWSWGVAGTHGTWTAAKHGRWVKAQIAGAFNGGWSIKGVKASTPPSSAATVANPAMRFGVHFNVNAWHGGPGLTWKVWGLPGTLPNFPSGVKALAADVWFNTASGDWRIAGAAGVK